MDCDTLCVLVRLGSDSARAAFVRCIFPSYQYATDQDHESCEQELGGELAGFPLPKELSEVQARCSRDPGDI